MGACVSADKSKPAGRAGAYAADEKGPARGAEPASSTAAALAPAHTDIVNCVAAGPLHGEWLSCSEDKSVLLYDARARAPILRWAGHKRGVNHAVAFEPTKGALSASRDGTVRIWGRESEQALAVLEGHELTVSAVAAIGGVGGAWTIVSGSRDCTVRTWDATTGKQTGSYKRARNLVTCMCPFPSGSPALVAQGSEDLSLSVLDVRTLQPALSLQPAPAWSFFALCVDVSADGKYVLAGTNGFSGEGCELRLFDTRTGGQLGEAVRGVHTHAVTGCAFLPHTDSAGSAIATASCSKDGLVATHALLPGGEGGTRTTMSPSAGGAQLTALACLNNVWPPPAGGAHAAAEVDAPASLGPGLAVSSVVGSVHVLGYGAHDGALSELWFTEPSVARAE